MPSERRVFYGWILVPFLWVIYGFGIGPAGVGFNLLAREMMDDLSMTQVQVGWIRSLRVLFMSLVAPMVGIALGRWGSRRVMTIGSFVAAVGFLIASQAGSVWGLFWGYSVISGLAMSFSTILPTQNLAATWFVRYRARAMSFILTAGGLVGGGVTLVLGYTLDHGGWRVGWGLIAGMSTFVGLLIAVIVRNSPADLGQGPDGDMPRKKDTAAGGERGGAAKKGNPGELKPTRHWTAAQAIRTPQFILLTLTGIAYSAPWGVLMTYGGLHLYELDFDTATVAGVLATLSFVSTVGRFAGALGDFVSPQILLGLGLALEALGLGGLGIAESPGQAYACVSVCGLGFGAAYISTPVVFSNFFGPIAFATATGTRFLIGGVFNAGVPIAVAYAFKYSESYTPSFLVVAGYGLLASLIALFCPKPGDPPEASEEEIA